MASEQNHPWCRDVSRDEAIRAAEDAAAAERTPLPDHRDLPAAVAELRERVGNIEALVGKAAVAGVFDGVGVPPSPATRPGETTAKHPVPPADGLRTERVTPPDWQQLKWDEALAIIHDGGYCGRGNGFHPGTIAALVIWADKEMARLTAERDAALRERDAANEECERLRAILPPESERGQGVGEGSWAVFACKAVAERDEARALHVKWVELATQARIERERLKARVAELEAAAAANSGGEAKQEPVAWGVKSAGEITQVALLQWRDSLITYAESHGGTVVPLYAAPQPPRGWLNSEERRTLENFVTGLRTAAMAPFHDEAVRSSLTKQANDVEALLARSTPPRVEGPTGWAYDAHDMAWIAAIREAGVEVE